MVFTNCVQVKSDDKRVASTIATIKCCLYLMPNAFHFSVYLTKVISFYCWTWTWTGFERCRNLSVCFSPTQFDWTWFLFLRADPLQFAASSARLQPLCRVGVSGACRARGRRIWICKGNDARLRRKSAHHRATFRVPLLLHQCIPLQYPHGRRWVGWKRQWVLSDAATSLLLNETIYVLFINVDVIKWAL